MSSTKLYFYLPDGIILRMFCDFSNVNPLVDPIGVYSYPVNGKLPFGLLTILGFDDGFLICDVLSEPGSLSFKF